MKYKYYKITCLPVYNPNINNIFYDCTLGFNNEDYNNMTLGAVVKYAHNIMHSDLMPIFKSERGYLKLLKDISCEMTEISEKEYLDANVGKDEMDF